ncbi:MAG: RnfH family protein, partial [Gammaproteobacteria bacterium]|nr:RnfH family protein [Gammaproteobacteria bacterium]
MPTDDINIEIAYATPEQQVILELQVASQSSPRDAVLQSNIDSHFPEIDKNLCDIGIFGKV